MRVVGGSLGTRLMVVLLSVWRLDGIHFVHSVMDSINLRLYIGHYKKHASTYILISAITKTRVFVMADIRMCVDAIHYGVERFGFIVCNTAWILLHSFPSCFVVLVCRQ